MTTRPSVDQARAYADALVAWAEGKRVEHNLYAEVAQGMIAELASLRARCDAAEKDAERYTKFRKWWFKYWASPSYEDDVSEAKTEAALDKAIDDLTAQRAKEGEPK